MSQSASPQQSRSGLTAVPGIKVGHFTMTERPTGCTVVLAHGFSVPYFVYDPTFEFLTQAGFRVLRYDLFGRGFSDRPQVGDGRRGREHDLGWGPFSALGE